MSEDIEELKKYYSKWLAKYQTDFEGENDPIAQEKIKVRLNTLREKLKLLDQGLIPARAWKNVHAIDDSSLKNKKSSTTRLEKTEYEFLILPEMLEYFHFFNPILKMSKDLAETVRENIIKIIHSGFEAILSDVKKFKDFIEIFETIAKEKCYYVRLSRGTQNYRKNLLGELKAKNFSKVNEKKEILKVSFDFLSELNNINPDADFIEELKKTNIIKISAGLPSYIIKLVSIMFPDKVLPIFNLNHLTNFIDNFRDEELEEGEEENYEETEDILNRIKKSMDLYELCREELLDKFESNQIPFHPTFIVNVLYRFGKFGGNEKIWNAINKLGFKFYPTDEESVSAIFFSIYRNSEYNFPDLWKIQNIQNLQFSKIATDYPDLIAFNPEDPKNPIYIEVEVLRTGYNHGKEEELIFGKNPKNLYVICWGDGEQMNPKYQGIAKNESRVIFLKEILLKSMEIPLK